jgi:hypothetical protein
MTATTKAAASPAGLTRGSISFRNKFMAKKMDCRVKPGNDEPRGVKAGGRRTARGLEPLFRGG